MNVLATSFTEKIVDPSSISMYLQPGLSWAALIAGEKRTASELLLVTFPNLRRGSLGTAVADEMKKYNVKKTSPNFFVSFAHTHRSTIADGLILNSMITLSEPGDMNTYNWLYITQKNQILQLYVEIDSVDTRFQPDDLFVVERVK